MKKLKTLKYPFISIFAVLSFIGYSLWEACGVIGEQRDLVFLGLLTLSLIVVLLNGNIKKKNSE